MFIIFFLFFSSLVWLLYCPAGCVQGSGCYASTAAGCLAGVYGDPYDCAVCDNYLTFTSMALKTGANGKKTCSTCLNVVVRKLRYISSSHVCRVKQANLVSVLYQIALYVRHFRRLRVQSAVLDTC
jgi:hypothetical protein